MNSITPMNFPFQKNRALVRISVISTISAFLLFGMLGCAPIYYYPVPQPPEGYSYSTHPGMAQPSPQVVVIKQCECPPQGLGFVKINSAPPFASVYVNGKPEGETPLEYLSIPAGTAKIEVIHRQFGPSDTTLVLKPGQKVDLKIRFPQADDPRF